MKMMIGGKPTGASDGSTFEILNPATCEVIDTAPAATAEDINIILENAKAGFAEWSAYPRHRRAEILRNCIKTMFDNREELEEILIKDTGLPRYSAPAEINTAAERASAAIEGAAFLEGDSFMPGNTKNTEDDLIITVREPLGVVLAIIPFNFPIGTFATKIWPALIMGNAVVVKLPSDDPLAINRLVELMIEAGVPGNALQTVTGSGAVLGKYLNTHPAFSAVSMTGSTKVGATVVEDSARNIPSVALELGGNDAFIILDDADIDQAVEQAYANRCNRSGQICHSSKRAIIHNSLKEEFITRLAALLASKKIGDPSDPDTIFGPLISEKAASDVEAQINHNVSQGAVIRCGGKRFDKTFVEPTILEATTACDCAHDMEIFGPVWTVIGFDELDEAIEIANSSMYGLSSGVLGKDITKLMKVARKIQAGACIINGGGSYVSPYAPMGGYKMSGIGRQSAMESLKEFSQQKTIVFRHLG